MGCLDCRWVQWRQRLAAGCSESAGPDGRWFALCLMDQRGDWLRGPCCRQAACQCSEGCGGDKACCVDCQLLEVCQVDTPGMRVVKL